MQGKQKTLDSFVEKDTTESEGYQPGADSIRGSDYDMYREPLDDLMERVLARDNLDAALRQVVGNRGAPGPDGMTVEQLGPWLAVNGERIYQKLRNGEYVPSPVRRKEIPKPNGGTRNLGIPNVLDRYIQQAIAQVLVPIYEPTFSEHSFGFRPGRSAKDAVLQAKSYIEQGYVIMVDIDISKFFDNLGHDLMMNILRERIKDKALVLIIKRFLRAGVVLPDGITIERSVKGAPQGGNLSPVLSNIYLDVLDKELEKRGLRFCRYADDLAIYVQSKRAGERVFEGVCRFLDRELHLKVNEDKSGVGNCRNFRYLGFKLFRRVGTTVAIAVHPSSWKKFHKRIVEITKRNRGRSMGAVIHELNDYLRGWSNYYNLADGDKPFKDADGHVRRRLRQYQFKLWKKTYRRYVEIRRLCPEYRILVAGVIPKDWERYAWHIAKLSYWEASERLSEAMPNRFFENLGLFSLAGSRH
ncbi:MAG: group II intron reverse transcriptase/maturase [archaeon]|nr:group II intron reverse transcriptase/maturase [archaeon]